MIKPAFAKKKIDFRAMHPVEEALSGLKLHTVCHQARCPNISECFGRGTATFLILGDICTRNCSFCSVKKGAPAAPAVDEAEKVSEAAEKLGLKYVVITSVTRDDLEDGGGAVFAKVITKVKGISQKPKVEVLTPDFQFNKDAIDKVISAGPDVFAHNVETVPSLYHVRKGASYSRSINVLSYIKEKNPAMLTKSAVLLGLGEKENEVLGVFSDLREAKCDFISIGQYLQPDREHYPVKEYIEPERFEYYRQKALDAGFKHAESGVWVRSSYLAEIYNNSLKV